MSESHELADLESREVHLRLYTSVNTRYFYQYFLLNQC